jgi:hypothetical protein
VLLKNAMELQRKVEKQAPSRIWISRSRSHKRCVNSAKQVPFCLVTNYSPPSVSLKAFAVLVVFSTCYEACGVRSTNRGIQNGALMLGQVKMKTHLIAVLFGCMVVSSLVLDNGVAQTRSAKEPSKTVFITGCLVKGDEPGEVWLAQKNGRIYGLEGGKIDLNAHLGQKVLVEGVRSAGG